MSKTGQRVRKIIFITAILVLVYALWKKYSELEHSGWPDLSQARQDDRGPGVRPSAITDADESLLPRIQHTFDPSVDAQQDRIAAVKNAVQHSWTGYRKHAWLKDELAPASAGHRTTFSGWASTLIDSLDTLWLVGLHVEFEEAVTAVATIDFQTPSHLPINVFETTIRYLGGLIAAYEVSDSQYPVLLEKAIEVAEMLLGAFNTPSRMPVLLWNKIENEPVPGSAIMSELATLSLEFIKLSQLTGNTRYADAVQRITNCIHRQQMSTKIPGLLPTRVNARDCDLSNGMEFSLGAHVDSAYEYMIKTHQFVAGTKPEYKKMYERALAPIEKHLLYRPMIHTTADILLAGTVKISRQMPPELHAQTEHLSCFAGGMLALSSKLLSQPEDLETAKKLTKGCLWASSITPTGIMPENFHAIPCPEPDDCTWDEERWGMGMIQKNSFDEQPSDRKLGMSERVQLKSKRLRMPKGMTAFASREYKLRPELVESLFVLYRITGDEQWREEAWNLFQAIVNQTRTEHGFSNIEDVTAPGSRKLDKMESYWIAETLKYFYLVFSAPELMSVDEWVFNTEGHPFRLDHGRRKD
jgi:mannosyl-oligosaccharide alpha-1,2-mannosidase